LEIAKTIASNAPLAVQAALACARAADRAARDAASAMLFEWNSRVVASADAAEGIASIMQKRVPVFQGK
jgi:enoyl-CoA hydratase